MVESGLRQASQYRLAFITPSHQQPLGVTMSIDRHFALLHAAEQRLTGLLDIVPTDTGLHTIGRLPPNISETKVAAAALERDIVVIPVERFCITPTEVKGLVLGFSGIKPPATVAGVDILAEVLGRLR